MDEYKKLCKQLIEEEINERLNFNKEETRRQVLLDLQDDTGERKQDPEGRKLAHPSNSKSEDTLGIVSTGALPECECYGRQLLTGGKLCVKCKAYLGQSEPPQYTSLTEITTEYFMATDPDRVALQRKVLAWHKAEIAKLFEQIRSEAVRMNIPWGDGNGYDVVKAIDVEVLTRLEKNEKVTE